MKKKINLKDLEVKSFLTKNRKDITGKRGGWHYTLWCPSDWTECDYTDLC